MGKFVIKLNVHDFLLELLLSIYEILNIIIVSFPLSVYMLNLFHPFQ